MTRFLLSLLLCFSAPVLAAGEVSGPAGHLAAPAPLSEGIVKKIDKAAGRITLAHGPLKNLDMPGMTMAFLMTDRAWLDRLKEGDRVKFLAEDLKGKLTITRIELAK